MNRKDFKSTVSLFQLLRKPKPGQRHRMPKSLPILINYVEDFRLKTSVQARFTLICTVNVITVENVHC